MGSKSEVKLKLTPKELIIIVHALSVYSAVAPKVEYIQEANRILDKIVKTFKEYVEALEEEVKKHG